MTGKRVRARYVGERYEIAAGTGVGGYGSR